MRAQRRLFLLILLAYTACDRPNFTTPVDAYLSMVKAIRKSEFKVAYGALTQRSRDLLSERAKAAAKSTQDQLTDDPMSWFFARGGRIDPVEKVELVGQSGDEATIRVQTDKGMEEWKLRKESGDWKLDLTPFLEGQPTP